MTDITSNWMESTLSTDAKPHSRNQKLLRRIKSIEENDSHYNRFTE